MDSTTETRRVHEGRNLKRIREMLRMKQSTLAQELGSDWNQKKVSQLEDRETIESDLLEEIASVLKVPVEAIKNFDENATVNFIASTFYDNASIVNTNCTLHINPLEKWIQAIEENKELYERLLQSEKEKVEMLEKFLKDK